MKARRIAIGVALVIAAGFGQAPAPASAADTAAVTNFAGRWRLNKDLSDKPPAVDVGNKDQAAGDKAPKLDKPGAPPPMDGRGAGSATTAPSGTEPPPEVTVRQNEVEIVAESKTADKVDTRNFYPNGKTYKADEGTADMRSYWKNGALVFEKKSQRGWKYSETWQLVSDGKQMRVDIHLGGGGQKEANLKRVYDRITDEKK
jgi:hypothetical protein